MQEWLGLSKQNKTGKRERKEHHININNDNMRLEQ